MLKKDRTGGEKSILKCVLADCRDESILKQEAFYC